MCWLTVFHHLEVVEEEEPPEISALEVLAELILKPPVMPEHYLS